VEVARACRQRYIEPARRNETENGSDRRAMPRKLPPDTERA
jgi:hypothetical protein